MLLLVVASVCALMLVVAVTTLMWMLEAWRTPASLDGTRFRGDGAAPPEPVTPAGRLRFSLIVPARHEEAVLGTTLDGLAALTHPDREVIVVVGDDDPATAAIAEQAAASHRGLRVVVDHSRPKNKPKALNAALPHCTGDVVGVFDAEDLVASGLLERVEQLFVTRPDVDVVQGGVQLMNFRSSWWALRNCLEYYFYFHSRLHLHARKGFIPLGGNTVFFRRSVLQEAGGWDPSCLAEDCDVGVRLSSSGSRVAVAFEPDLVTREETPDTISSLLRQRTRWNQGFLQVLKKREWRRLPTPSQRLLARYTLSMPFLQAFVGISVPAAMVMAFTLSIPLVAALLTFIPAAIMTVTVAVETAALREFGRSFSLKIRVRDYIRLVVGFLPYQL
ncbi:MAG TPA: glycosyltransferase, partial [Microthrixaceae bacterium]|nr:glycosyltransferase [Microthrixaceae bacterium]